MSPQRYRHFPPFPSCFRPSPAADNRHMPSPQTAAKTSLATSLYDTNIGLFSLTWSRTFLGHSLHLHHHHHHLPSSSLSVLSSSALHFHLNIKSFAFWKKKGCKKLSSATVPNVKIFWDLSRAKFGSGPEPDSGFFVAVVVDGEMTILVGDATKEAYTRTRAQNPGSRSSQTLVLRKEHVLGNRVYSTKARFGGKLRDISIDCRVNEHAQLCLSVDNKRVLQIKRLKWKFRGNERIEVDGVWIGVSWDVYSWLFDKDGNNGRPAVFIFKFENQGSETMEDPFKEGVVLGQQSPCSDGIEWKKKRRSLLRSARSSSSSSISMSSASSGCSSSVMEWESVEESELCAPMGFSLLVYAWRN
ncbi:uncharacterized protein LOC108485445 [Gossypium arboreum]|uniref:Uncharacterized protein n=1 Tax=Gossypium arboreum TaxID=29729 RepID=A0ABR0PLU4_GOSAR|nr:uncharacterized protein LOC108485445 [Gossypium arboreum]KAK5825251.1 hypothetical protein PVK06_020064 [Gossypium arboreum]